MKDRRAILMAVAALLAVPSAAAAQPPDKVFRIGLLFNDTPTPEGQPVYDTFAQALREHGFVEGRNVALVWRFAEGREGRHAEFAAEFVAMQVDLIVAAGSGATNAAKAATGTIPIVMAYVANPERLGLVASLARPGGNVTGTASTAGIELGTKLFQVVKDVLPGRSRIAFLWNPDNPASALSLKGTDVPVALALGLTPIALAVRRADDLDQVFASMLRERVEVIRAHEAVWAHQQRLIEFSLEHRIPIVAGGKWWSQAGALASYGADARDAFRKIALYAVKIMRGAKPADLPVEQPTKFELTINLKTAAVLGIAIPPAALALADEVIE